VRGKSAEAPENLGANLLRKENGCYFFFFFVAFLTAFLTAFLIFFLAAMRNLLRCYYDLDRRARSHTRT
jgi:hypothetical protein